MASSFADRERERIKATPVGGYVVVSGGLPWRVYRRNSLKRGDYTMVAETHTRLGAWLKKQRLTAAASRGTVTV